MMLRCFALMGLVFAGMCITGGARASALGSTSMGGTARATSVAGAVSPELQSGGFTTCGITSAGLATCYGSDNEGTVNGHPTGDNSFRSGSPPEGRYAQLSIGDGHHGCGVQIRGRVMCWGDNSAGELTGFASGAHIGSHAGGGSFVQVASGSRHSCAIHTNGMILCWGQAADGEVDGTTTNAIGEGSPPGGGSYRQVSAGYQYSCGLHSNGTVLCWGSDASGQLDGQPGPTLVGAPPAGGYFTQISAGFGTTCALKTDASILCWGSDQFGQVDGVVRSGSNPTAVGGPPGGGSFRAVSVGDLYTCGLRTNGAVFCWGYDKYGQVNGKPVSASPYFAKGAPAGGGAFASISAGASGGTGAASGLDHTCAVRANGTGLCWGFDQSGEVNGQPVSAAPNSAVGAPPGQHLFLSGGVSAGTGDVCTVNANGSTTCTGSDVSGQLDGKPSGNTRAGSPPRGGAFIQVSPGAHHTCAVLTNGTLRCWGNNSRGLISAPSGLFTQVTSGDAHTCALRPDGAALCWGDEDLIAAGVFLDISAGSADTCGVRVDSSLVCWGKNAGGQAPRRPKGQFLSVAAGSTHTCAVKVDHGLQCWGANVVTESTPWVGAFQQVAVGIGFSCALAIDGHISCWGRSPSGATNPPSGSFSSLAASGNHACAIRTSGARVCWGARTEFSG